ncbi:MAG: SBBP repeat-containing protein, partial [Spirochaetota bacterium]|nr:SBBP repeat-containing protein [Spirochaetota bacterium]
GDLVTVTVDVGGGVCTDLAGNSNTAAGQFSIVYDSTASLMMSGGGDLGIGSEGNLPSPTGLAASDSVHTGFIRITWNTVADVDAYFIYRDNSESGSFANVVGTVASTTYDDTSAVAGTTYYYRVKAYSSISDTFSGFSGTDSGVRAFSALSAPTGVSASDGTDADYVKIRWNSVVGADSYYVYRDVSESGKFIDVIGTIASTSFEDTSAVVGTRYYYKLKANNSSSGVFSDFSDSDEGWRLSGTVGQSIVAPEDGGVEPTPSDGEEPSNEEDAEDLIYWNKQIDDDTNENSNDFARSVTTDVDGNVYVVGSANNCDWWIKKFDTDGNEDTMNWDKRFDGTGGDDAVNSIAVDPDGNVYIVGYGSNLVGEASGLDLWVKRFDSNGIEDTVNWDKRFDGTGGDDAVNSVAVDPDGNVYVGGYGSNLVGDASGLDLWIKRFDSNGIEDTVNWDKRFDGIGGDDAVNSIAVDPDGNVYVVGYGSNLVGEASGLDLWIKKFDSDGNEDMINWDMMFDGNNSNDEVSSAAVDSEGSVYIVGYGNNLVQESSGEDWWIKKFDSEGKEDTIGWNMMIDGNEGDDTAYSVVVDSGDNVYVAGYGSDLVNQISSLDLWIKRYDRNGVEDITNWRDRWYDGNGSDDVVNSIAIDIEGNVYIVGFGVNLVNELSAEDWWIKKFNK